MDGEKQMTVAAVMARFKDVTLSRSGLKWTLRLRRDDGADLDADKLSLSQALEILEAFGWED